MGVVLIGRGIVNDAMDNYVRVGMVVVGGYTIPSVLALPPLRSSIGSIYSMKTNPSGLYEFLNDLRKNSELSKK
jgi:hypothetical protein